MRGLVKWVWRRKIILTAASSIAGLVVTARRKAKPGAEPGVASAPLAPAPSKPAPAPPKPPAVAKPAPAPAVSSQAPAPAPPQPAADPSVPAGSVVASADGSAPSGEYVVKAKLKSKIFHTESSPNYARTKADVWFKNAADAQAAGFRAATDLKRP